MSESPSFIGRDLIIFNEGLGELSISSINQNGLLLQRSLARPQNSR